MNLLELLAEDVKRGVRILGGMADMVAGVYKCVYRVYWEVSQNIVVIGKLCGMGGLFFIIKRATKLEELYEREKEQKEDAELKNVWLQSELDKARHNVLVVRMNSEFHATIIDFTYDTKLCNTYNVFDDKMNELIHKCNQLRINKEIEFGKRDTLYCD
jgi:hypothetical protein